MSPSSNPPPSPPLMPGAIDAHERHPRKALRWIAWAALTMLTAVIASFGDRVVGRMLAAFDDTPVPRPDVRVVVVPAPAPAPAPAREHARVLGDQAAAAAAVSVVDPPQSDLMPIESEPAGPEGAAGIVAAIRAGRLRPAGRSDIAEWMSRYRAQGGVVDQDALGGSMRPAYVVTGELSIPGGLYGAHSVIFIVPRGVPYPSGDPGHSMVLDVGSGACVGAVCQSLEQ